MRVVVAGDWHGDADFAKQVIDEVAEIQPDLFLHVGDFGLGFGESFVEYVNKWLHIFNLHLVVTLGNHDDWDRVESILATDRYVALPDYNNILLAPRLGVVNGIAHIGGAVSVDQAIRHAHVNWWPQEALTIKDELTAVQLGPQDIKLVISHDAPASAPTPLMPRPPQFWRPYLDSAAQNRTRLDMIVSELIGDSKPILVHGHYHNRYTAANVMLDSGGELAYVHGLGDNNGTVADNMLTLTLRTVNDNVMV